MSDNDSERDSDRQTTEDNKDKSLDEDNAKHEEKAEAEGATSNAVTDVTRGSDVDVPMKDTSAAHDIFRTVFPDTAPPGDWKDK